MGLSAGLIDDLLLLPQDYRSSSLGGEGNSSEHSRESEREREKKGKRESAGVERGQRERERERRGGHLYENGRKDRRRQVGGKTEGEERGKEIGKIRRARWRQREKRGDVQMCL